MTCAWSDATSSVFPIKGMRSASLVKKHYTSIGEIDIHTNSPLVQPQLFQVGRRIEPITYDPYFLAGLLVNADYTEFPIVMSPPLPPRPHPLVYHEYTCELELVLSLI